MGLINGILIYKYARRRANKRRDRQDAREQETLGGSWDEEICDYCGRTNEEHLDDTEPCSRNDFKDVVHKSGWLIRNRGNTNQQERKHYKCQYQ